MYLMFPLLRRQNAKLLLKGVSNSCAYCFTKLLVMCLSNTQNKKKIKINVFLLKLLLR